MSEHGPQDERPLITQYPDGSNPAPADHGPQRQPASNPESFRRYMDFVRIEADNDALAHENAALRAEVERLRSQRVVSNIDVSRLQAEVTRLTAELASSREMLDREVVDMGHEVHESQRLRAENERLRAALHQFECDDNWVHFTNDEYTWDVDGDPKQLAADALRGEER